ncbi:hypothetical protein FJP69_13335 [Stenotrophomonas maltophilia]|nr:hypothetical protein FJP69_13335 [Stenotrophomonas maltophilia]
MDAAAKPPGMGLRRPPQPGPPRPPTVSQRLTLTLTLTLTSPLLWPLRLRVPGGSPAQAPHPRR